MDVPVFAGFEQPRYQQHDTLIAELAADFNANKAEYAGATVEQAAGIPDITAALVKSWMIQESGGMDERSRVAWRVDPANVNVPGDWSDAKRDLGLTRPEHRNSGDVRTNLRAAIMYLIRKGFGNSGEPARHRPGGRFDSWRIALERYNGRSVRTINGLPFYENYAQRILDRADDPGVKHAIALPKPATKKTSP